MSVLLIGCGGFADSTAWAAKAEVDQGLAWRNILQYQRWPAFFARTNPLLAKESGIWQSLGRFWWKRQTDAGTLNIELEVVGTRQSTPRQTSGQSGIWSEPTRDTHDLEFRRWTKEHLSHAKSSVSSGLARFDYRWSWGAWDLDLGRQPISLGTSHFVGILDVLTPFHPGYLDGSYKPGVDALRIRTGIGTAGEAELIGVAAEAPDRGALLGRFRNSFSGFDVELVAGRFRDRNLLGLGYDGERKRITYWGEVGLFERKPQRERIWSGSSKFALSWIAGLEKEVVPSVRLGLAFLHQDFGVKDPENLGRAYRDAPFQEGWAFLGGREHGIFTLRIEVSPLVKADLSGIVNLHDHSSLWQPKLTLNTGNCSDVTFFGWLSGGKAPAATLTGVSTPAEFGMFPDGIGVLLRRFY